MVWSDLCEIVQATTEVVEKVKAAATEAATQVEAATVSESTSSKGLSGGAAWYQQNCRAVPEDVDARTVYYGPDRPLWKGPLTEPKDVPEWLTGEFPGDYGCDIFKLVRLPANFARLRSQASTPTPFLNISNLPHTSTLPFLSPKLRNPRS